MTDPDDRRVPQDEIANAERIVNEVAIEEYAKLVERHPNDLVVLRQLGDLLCRAGRIDEACKSYVKIAERLEQDGSLAEATAMVATINALDPSRLDVCEKLGDLLAKQGLTAEAEGQYRVVVNHWTERGDFVSALAIEKKINRLTRDLKRQREGWQRQKELRATAMASVDELVEKGEIEKAIEEYRRLGAMQRIADLTARRAGHATSPTLEVTAQISHGLEKILDDLCERFGLRRGFTDWDSPSSMIALSGDRFSIRVFVNTAYPSGGKDDDSVTLLITADPEDDLSDGFDEELASWLVESLGAAEVRVNPMRMPFEMRQTRGVRSSANPVLRHPVRPENELLAPPAVTLRFVLLERNGGHPASIAVGDSISCRLDATKPIIVGRATGVDVFIQAPTVGQRVVRLSLDGRKVRITDLGSGGGSALEVDGEIVHRPDCELPDRATLKIGGIAFRVEIVPVG